MNDAPLDTARHLMETAARLSVRSRVLERLLCMFSGASPAERIWNDLLDLSMEAVPCEASSFFLAGTKGALTIVAARGSVSDQILGLKLKRGQGLAGACLLDRRVIAVSDVKRDPRHAAQMAKALGFETRSLLAVPVVHGGDALGVIELINRTGGDDFERHEVDLVERVGRSAGDLLALRTTNGRGR